MPRLIFYTFAYTYIYKYTLWLDHRTFQEHIYFYIISTKISVCCGTLSLVHRSAPSTRHAHEGSSSTISCIDIIPVPIGSTWYYFPSLLDITAFQLTRLKSLVSFHPCTKSFFLMNQIFLPLLVVETGT